MIELTGLDDIGRRIGFQYKSIVLLMWVLIIFVFCSLAFMERIGDTVFGFRHLYSNSSPLWIVRMDRFMSVKLQKGR